MTLNAKAMSFGTLRGSIWTSLRKLRGKLHEMQFYMTKANRIVYGDRLLDESNEVMEHFVLAYELHDAADKLHELDLLFAKYAVLRVDIDNVIERNLAHYPKRKPKEGEDPEDPNSRVSAEKVNLYELLGKIDADIDKWRTSLAKGTTVAGDEAAAD